MFGRFVLVLFAATAVQGIGETCRAKSIAGTCISTATCTGLSTRNLCPGPADIQCCTLPPCTVPGFGSGLCKKTSFCGGTAKPGFCPGPANVQCCIGGGVDPVPPGPNPEPPGPEPEPPGPNPEPPGPEPEPPGPNPEPPGPEPEPPGPNPEPPGPNPPDPVPGELVPIPPGPPTDDACMVGTTEGYCVDTFFCKGTVTAGQCPGRPAAVKCCTNQPTVAPVPGLDEYLPALAVQWGAKASVDPFRVFEWLRRDLAETLQGGQARFGTRYPGDLHVGRSWLIGRQEHMWFRHNNPGRALSSFTPVAAPRMTSSEIPGAGESAKVTQLLIDFARAIKPMWPGVSLGTYAGHGGGSFNDAGFSTDIFIPGRDDRGFFRHADAVAFCKKVHEACQAVGCDWRIIYNDFRVADEVNRFFGTQHIIFVGSARVKNGRATNLNWHGPLVLHFHLDIIARSPTSASALSPATIPEDTRTVPLPPPPPPAGDGVACTVNGVTGVCKDWRTCDGTTTSNKCPGNSDIRCCTPRTFVETSSTTQRLPSRLRSIPRAASESESSEQQEQHREENVLQP